jgi:fucose 4-O-acetylase-like acetyltransferase
VSDNRNDVIDIAKAISIILVAVGHSHFKVIYPDVNHVFALFRMPLFFFLSGIFFSTKLNFGTFAIRKIDAIYKPYFVTLAALFIITYAFGGQQNEQWPFWGILYGTGDTIRWNPLWFLSHLCLVYILAYLVDKYIVIVRFGNTYKLLLIATLLYLSTLTIGPFWQKSITFFGEYYILPGLPLSLDLLPLSLGFFFLGNMFKLYILRFKINYLIFSLLVLILLVIAYFSSAQLAMNYRVFEEYLYTLLAACSGIYVVVSISQLISTRKVLSRLMTTIGSSSLFILLFHDEFGRILFIKMQKYLNAEFILFNAIIALVLSIFLPVVLKQIVLRNEWLGLLYLPLIKNKFIKK